MLIPSHITEIKAPGSTFLADTAPVDNPMKSRVSKQIKTIKEPVPRYFESLNQIQGYWAEGEYDLIEIFKLLKHEAYFFKATQKKLSLLIKGGFSVQSDDDTINEYFQARFTLMEVQTGTSIKKLIEQLAFYLIVCSNAFIVKVRDKDVEHSSSYKKDGKDVYPIVGLFLVHPTSLKPRFKWVKFPDGEQVKHKLELVKWVYVNRRGVIVEFDPSDVVHLTLYKEEGMAFGTPEVISVIDDIRTLRKMEDDTQLLVYRDLFPILHYAIENPTMIDHLGMITELDQAKRDLERMMQDGGIATDARHKINYIGSQGKHLEIKPYLEYFQNRVFSGLGVSQTDMGLGSGIGGNTADSMSKQLMDAVRFIQQEVTRQFDEQVLTEMVLSSPFGYSALKQGIRPSLKFEEIDLEWQIRKENHHADQFTKGVLTVDEVRDPRGLKTLNEETEKRTQTHMYGDLHPHKINLEQQKIDQAQTKIDQSAAKADLVKKNKSNSNITKSKRVRSSKDDAEFLIEDIDIAKEYLYKLELLDSMHPIGKRFNLKLETNDIYNTIKDRIKEQFARGMQDAISRLDVESFDIRQVADILSGLYKNIDKLSDDVSTKVCNDYKNYYQRAAIRVAMTDRTEQVRAYNCGFAFACIQNGITNFSIKHYDSEDIMSTCNIEIFDIEAIPPFHTNSKSILTLTDEKTNTVKVRDYNELIVRDKMVSEISNAKFSKEYLQNTYGYSVNDFVDDIKINHTDAIVEEDKQKLEILNKLCLVTECIKELKDRTDDLSSRLDQNNKNDIDEFNKVLNDRVFDMINAINDTTAFQSNITTKYIKSIESIITSINGISKDNMNAIRAIADSMPREFTVNTPPVDVNINNPPMEVTLNIKDSQQTQKPKKVNIVRDKNGQIQSASVEELDE
jgi:hypothetical protein